MALRFHLDEHVHPAIAHGLRQRGIDVTTTAEAGLLGGSDSTQLEHASRQGRVLVTHHRVFLVLSQTLPEHPGIAYCHQQTRTIGQMIRSLANLSATHTAETMTKRVVFL